MSSPLTAKCLPRDVPARCGELSAHYTNVTRSQFVTAFRDDVSTLARPTSHEPPSIQWEDTENSDSISHSLLL
eukprot:64254-Prorocentrum_minimum.AAC.1